MKTGSVLAILLLLFASFCFGEPGPYVTSADLIPRAAWRALPAVDSKLPGEALVPMGRIAYVTVHQTESVTPKDDPESERGAIRRLQSLHLAGKKDEATGQAVNRMGDIAYHFLIAPSGRVYEGRSPQFQTNSNTTYLTKSEWLKSERYSFGESEGNKENAPWGGTKGKTKSARPGAVAGHLTIVFVGNYTHSLPPKPALDAFVALLADQLKEHTLGIRDVFMHREIASTDCPGEPLYIWLRNPAKNPRPGADQYPIGEGLARVSQALRKRSH